MDDELILKFERPRVKQEYRIPNVVEWLERHGYVLKWNVEDKRVSILYPPDMSLPGVTPVAGIGLGIAKLLCQDKALHKCINEFVRNRHERQVAEAKSILVGGEFDGERVECSKCGGTFCRKVRHGWWAVYVRKHGNYHADIVGYATSETKGKTCQYAMKLESTPQGDDGSSRELNIASAGA